MIVKKYKHVEKEGSSSLVSTRDTGEESGNAEKTMLQVRLARLEKALAQQKKSGTGLQLARRY
jgi:hypothetical protein